MRWIVAGTGTEIGKTHVSACLCRAATRAGRRLVAYKPVATGVTVRADGSLDCEDADAHAAALGRPPVPPRFAYRRPVSPHLAAREEGRPIALEVIAREAAALERDAELLLVETAGGLFSPLGPGLTNADLVATLAPARLVLVAPDRLGVLHDLGATLRAARAAGLTVDAVALSAPAAPDQATGSHRAELAALDLWPDAVVFPRAPFDAPESQAAAAALLGQLGR